MPQSAHPDQHWDPNSKSVSDFVKKHFMTSTHKIHQLMMCDFEGQYFKITQARGLYFSHRRKYLYVRFTTRVQ